MTPTMIVIDHEEAQSAGGDVLAYSYVELVAFEGEWRCTRRVLSGEHWGPSVDRAVCEAMNRYRIPSKDVLDMRE